jgi:tRNA dimethylallyltransferase
MNLDLIAIVGPTASGKTRLGVEVAHRLGSEIVSADSRQVYRGLDIGTGKDLAEYSAVTPPVPYHMIDIAEAEEVYTLFRYQQDCYRVLRKLAARVPFADGETPAVFVGGSGLYVESVIREYRLADVPNNGELRDRLSYRDREELAAELEKRWPDLAGETDVSSKRRIIRAFEIGEYRQTRPVQHGEPSGLSLRFQVFGIDVAREKLRRRIGLRLRARLEEGMVEEVQGLLDRGLDPGRLGELGLEYREIAAYLLGKKTRERMTSDLEIAIGRFAKRQQTWFFGMGRRGVPVRWIGPEDADVILTAVGKGR